MVFAFSANALAVDTVDLVINGGTPIPVNIGADTTVYDIVNGAGLGAVWGTGAADLDYSPLYDSGSPLYGHYSNQVKWLTEFDSEHAEPHIPAAGAIDEYDEYVQGYDEVLDYINGLQEVQDCDGIYMSFAWAIGDGYFLLGDMEHMLYVGEDWMFKVDYASDGYGTFVKPGVPTTITYPRPYDFFQYYMNESLLSNGDIVSLDYDLVMEIFTF